LRQNQAHGEALQALFHSKSPPVGEITIPSGSICQKWQVAPLGTSSSIQDALRNKLKTQAFQDSRKCKHFREPSRLLSFSTTPRWGTFSKEKLMFDENGFDPLGYDANGYNAEGVDRQGFDRTGRDTKGDVSEGTFA
jgi:hypothetical protein